MLLIQLVLWFLFNKFIFFRMTMVGRLEGFSEPDLLLQRMRTIVNEFEINLVQARADRFEQSINR